MANELAKMSLKQATPLQSSFTPFQYTPKPLDTTSLERSLDKIEAIRNGGKDNKPTE